MNLTNINLTVIFDAFTNWFAMIIVWLKTTTITIWTFTFTMYDFVVISVVFEVFFYHILKFWAGSEAREEFHESEAADNIGYADYDWWGD